MAPLEQNASARPTSGRVHSVVVPIDGTDASARGVTLAQRLAARLGAELLPVSIIKSFRDDASERVARLRKLLAAIPPTVETRVVQARSVARTIAEESVDGLVCIATSAQPFDEAGFRHSVTDELVASASSPVIVLGPNCNSDSDPERVVVAIDPAHDQQGLVYWATRLAYDLSVPLEYVHVSPSRPSRLSGKVRHEPLAAGESLADRLISLSEGGLLAMGSHGRTGFRRLAAGSVGAAVIARATQPIMMLGPNATEPRGRQLPG